MLDSSVENNSNNLSLDYQMTHDEIFFPRPEEMLVPWLSNDYFIPIVLTYALALVIGVTGNLVAISVMAGDRTSRNATSVFLVSLAVADLLLLVICAPLDVAHYFVVQWDYRGTVCKMAAYAEMVSAFASVLNLAAVSLERFVVIVFPMHSRSVCTMSNCKRLVVGVWLVSVLLAGPVIGAKNTYRTTVTNHKTSVTLYSCKEAEDWRGLGVAVYRLVTLFALPSVLMIFCYAWVITELWISTKTMDELTSSVSSTGLHRSQSISHPQQQRFAVRTQTDIRDVKRARQQVIKMLILVVLLFLVCWGPRLVMELVLRCCLYGHFTHGTYTLRFIFYLLPFVHSCLNPIVYCFMSTKFRHKVRSICRRTNDGRTTGKRQLLPGGSNSSCCSSRVNGGRLGSTYTFTSFAGSPSAEINVRVKDLETITL